MYTLEEIYEAISVFDFSFAKHQIYDDWNCDGADFTGNNGTSTAACSSGDPEYTGEEGDWTLYTDSDLNGALVASGMVFKDERTGLFWADCYDSTSGQGSCDTLTNSFTIGTGCSDAVIIAGECDSSMYQTKGNAIQYCLDLSLDADGDGTDETDWRLPTQKELMQAYINGAANNLPNAGGLNFWSATEVYSSTANAWNVVLYYGRTLNANKGNGYNVRCARP